MTIAQRIIHVGVILTLLASMLAACKGEFTAGVSEETLKAMDGAIQAIRIAPAAWEAALRNLLDQVGKDASDLAKQAVKDVNQLLLDGIAAVQANIQCIIDSLGIRILDALLVIQAKLKGEPATLPSPGVCQITPDHIDLTRDQDHMFPTDALIKVYGFNFFAERLPELELLDGSKLPDGGDKVVAKYDARVSRNTRYQITVQLQGLDFSSVTPKSTLRLNWGKDIPANSLRFVIPSQPHVPMWVIVRDSTIPVGVTRPDIDSGIDLLPLDRLQISCMDVVKFVVKFPGRTFTTSYSPDGSGGGSTLPFQGARYMAVIGRIGSDGPYFRVGSAYDDTYASSFQIPKRLLLRINIPDDLVNASSWQGAYTCRVLVNRYQ